VVRLTYSDVLDILKLLLASFTIEVPLNNEKIAVEFDDRVFVEVSLLLCSCLLESSSGTAVCDDFTEE
jgi:hypothetical protein